MDCRIEEKIVSTPGGIFGEFLGLLVVLEKLMDIDLEYEKVKELLETFVQSYMRCEVFHYFNLDLDKLMGRLDGTEVEDPINTGSSIPINIENMYLLPEDKLEELIDWMMSVNN
mmetsp:Transcript_3617/g.2183  ORF Transcript_3617/g.2183 Transcript_3617/m.2183 type:complete len:114 (-) Transcript_3617:36-377(-)|eukprot:CAMPEP_0201285842 /NCGR_PEP_ID=MMETSP1317-20130820/113901_1 /ASSEMBLY_ACC=CAM_ASM_000770 /TAXON_ID=187299 /ORGANISM="Undescribed Undescribed, Strain Undescribed" /LENGTH=113 /DNA_ID=CAMNT_0047611897 /DNA_START=1276 /DNA_END=1617 /DNA_ORIENTATION=-